MSYERASEDLGRLLGDVLETAAKAQDASPAAGGECEGHDPDRTVRAVVAPGGRIESVEIGPRAARLGSQEIAERAMAAINDALDAMAASSSPAGALDDELIGRLRETQDQSLRQLGEYTQSLRDLMNGFER
ncbi:YbaB/EbfC family nucleoid-associated protein [Actinomadura latina]|uniref:YbaB/EbfC family nucleoid-associated protein n=1 Tax=Actinomadura latina TaxID=163603 RepID=A0A846Z223_9ACTN|nr:YbaB/EbfC family nucleoid-associated protein [Actinomadura latina]NKZ05957.1 YbaB/EbfC family nucleoid-associated protein [Actinomadura latina]